MSLVCIRKDGERIQTAAYSNIRKKIFALKTYNKMLDTATSPDVQSNTNLDAFNGLYQYVPITGRKDDGENIINLMVCSFT